MAAGSTCIALLVVSSLASVALPVATVVVVDPHGSNTTIVIGYFVQPPESRIAVIGMAIRQAQSDGLLRGYGFE